MKITMRAIRDFCGTDFYNRGSLIMNRGVSAALPFTRAIAAMKHR